MSHPSQVWPATADKPAARHLTMHDTGRMLAISRGDPLRAAAERMSQEGYGPDCIVCIKDADGIAPDVSSTIAAALKGAGSDNPSAIGGSTPRTLPALVT